MKFMNEVLKKLFFKPSQDYYEEFKCSLLIKNLRIAKIVFIATIIIECFVAFMFLQKCDFQFNFVLSKFYFRMYIFLIVISILGIGIIKFFRDKVDKHLLFFQRVQELYFLCFLIWSILISIHDINNGGTSIVYLQMIMSIGVFFYIKFSHALIIYSLAQLYYLIMLLSLNLRYHYVYPEIINSITMIILMLVITYSKNKMKWNNFNYIKIIEEKNRKLKIMNEELYTTSIYDPLTQVYNRRKIMEEFKREYLLCREKHQECACCIVDIDFFKKYNDTYGHWAGDECIQKVSKKLKKIAVKYNGHIGRYGGEEFLLIFTKYSPNDMEKISKELRMSIEELKIPHKSSKASSVVTLSMGVYLSIPSKDKTIQYFIEEADKMLYSAKEKGRNTCVINEDI